MKRTLLWTALAILLMNVTVAIPRTQSIGTIPNPDIVIMPQHPSIHDKVNVSVSFNFNTAPPSVKEFGQLTCDGNTFSVNITIFVPAPDEPVLFIVHTDRKTYNLENLSEGSYRFQVYVYYTHYMEGFHYLAGNVLFNVGSPTAMADVRFDPFILSYWNKDGWVTAYIELREGYNINDINISTILLNASINIDQSIPGSLGDHDHDGISDLVVRFPRSEVVLNILKSLDETRLIEEGSASVTLTVTGCLNYVTSFQGNTNVKIVLFPPKGLAQRAFPV